MKHDEQCNCDQALALKELLSEARTVIKDLLLTSSDSLNGKNAVEFLEEIQDSWAFRSQESLRDYVTNHAMKYFGLTVRESGLWVDNEKQIECGQDTEGIMKALWLTKALSMSDEDFCKLERESGFLTLIQGTEKTYRVTQSKAGNWMCMENFGIGDHERTLCRGFKFRGTCKHITEAQGIK